MVVKDEDNTHGNLPDEEEETDSSNGLHTKEEGGEDSNNGNKHVVGSGGSEQ